MSRLPSIKGFNISPPIRVNGGHLLSMRGPLGTVASFVGIQSWHPRNIIAFGQNGACEGISRMEMEAHMIVVVPDHSMVETAGSIDEVLIHALKQDGFDYAHMIAGFQNGVRLAVFGEAFERNPHGEVVVDALFRMFFTDINTMSGLRDMSSLVLLIGGSGNRGMGAKILNRDHSFKILPSPLVGSSEPRHAVVGKQLLLTFGFETKTLHGIDADTIVDYLTSENGFPVWAEHRIGQSIEDIAVIDGTRDTVIITLSDGDFRLVPTVIRMKNDELELNPSTAEGVRVEDLQGEVLSPIVRVADRGREIVLVCQDGRATLVRFERADAFGAKFQDMIKRACTQQLSAHRP